MSEITIGPYQDRQRRTCIVVGNSKTSVELVVLDTASGLRVSEMSESSFTKDYKTIPGYPLHKAIEQYIEFAAYCGMTEQVKELFSEMLNGLKKKEGIDTSLALLKLDNVKVLSTAPTPPRSKATKCQAAKLEDDTPPWDDDEPSTGKAKAKEKKQTPVSRGKHDGVSPKRATNKATKQQPKEDKKTMSTTRATKTPSTGSQKNTGSIKVGKPSAAQMFRELILAGSYDDDTIFKMVQKEFGLDDGKRNYVSYYRRELKQKGLI